MRIVQVSQTEQASIQAAFSLVRTLSGMYAPLYFTNHYFNTSWTSEPPHLLTRPALSSCSLPGWAGRLVVSVSEHSPND